MIIASQTEYRSVTRLGFRYKFFDVFLVCMLIAISTIPIFRNEYGRLAMLICLFLSRSHFRGLLKSSILTVLVIMICLELYHFTYFPKYDFGIVREVIFSFLVGAFVSVHLNTKFVFIYVRVIYVITIISFFFYTGVLISPSMMHYIESIIPEFFKVESLYSTYYGENMVRINPIIYNFDYNFYELRNNGPFWEPTVFASLILLAQIFNYVFYKKVFNKQGIIFSIGIITTLSTTIFICYFIFLSSTILLNPTIGKKYKVFLFLATFSINTYLFFELPYLQNKIQSQLTGLDENLDSTGDFRLASAILDLTEIADNSLFILFGKGSDRDSRIGSIDKTVLRNCGITALLVEWGVFFFLMYIGLIYYTFRKLSIINYVNPLFSLSCTLCVLVMAFSEIFFDLPLFHTLIFLGFCIKAKVILPEYNNNLVTDIQKNQTKTLHSKFLINGKQYQ